MYYRCAMGKLGSRPFYASQLGAELDGRESKWGESHTVVWSLCPRGRMWRGIWSIWTRENEKISTDWKLTVHKQDVLHVNQTMDDELVSEGNMNHI